jgi:hypothetical protein
MKIAIVGSGWVGCHLAHKLKEQHDIVVYEKNSDIFKETSYNNQNRLHLGFHYARNSKTRNLCRETFGLFLNDYGFLTSDIKNGLYCIPKSDSLIDYETYIDIFRNYEYLITTSNLLNNVEGSISVGERYIDFEKAHDFFWQKLSNNIVFEKINDLKDLSKKYDLVINATNNHLNPFDNYFYELTISLIYNKVKETDFGSLTFVDGQLFSLFPYKNELFTLTDVEHTPIKIFNNSENMDTYKESGEIEKIIPNKRNLMEEKIKKFFPEFNTYFEYSGYFLSTKSKIISESDSRYPLFKRDGNIINGFTGKIQGIYIIENYIRNEINNW